MKRSFSRRLARARANTPVPPPDFSAMTEMQQVMWAAEVVGFTNLVRAAHKLEDAEGTVRTTD